MTGRLAEECQVVRSVGRALYIVGANVTPLEDSTEWAG